MSVLNVLLAMGAIGIICALGLAWASKRFAVEVDERLEEVLDVLPGANCGACGFGSCAALADAVIESVDRGRKFPRCVLGGEEVIGEIEDALGVQIPFEEKKISTLLCSGGTRCNNRYNYVGVDDCWEDLALIEDGEKSCKYGCLGHGSCVKACPFGAITMGKDNLPIIDKGLCTGCGTCVRICPKNVLGLAKATEYYYVACSSKDKGRDVRKKCEIGCIACKKCERECPEDAVHVVDNLAIIDPNRCTGCGICFEVCPTHVIFRFEAHPIFWKFRHLLRRL